MQTIIKVSKRCILFYCSFIIAIAAMSHFAHAQVITPYIVLPPSTIQPDCHTYTGCGVIIEKRYSIHHYYRHHYYGHHYRRHCGYSVVSPDAFCSESY